MADEIEADNSAKAGARHNSGDSKHISEAYDAAETVKQKMVALGHAPADVPAKEPWAKSEGIETDEAEDWQPETSIKALGDMVIEVKVAFGGPFKGKDAHGEKFSARTDFDLENFPTPPATYYHGYNERGKKEAKPLFQGRTISRESRADGHYLKVKLKKGNAQAEKTYKAAQEGKAVASPATLPHLIRKGADGHLDYWPIAEIAIWDSAPGRAPANPWSVAVPALKSLYKEAGIKVPALFDNTDESGQQPQDGTTGPDVGAAKSANGGGNIEQSKPNGVLNMETEELNKLIADGVANAMKSLRDAEAVEKERQLKEQERIDAAVKAAVAQERAEHAKGRRLPLDGKAPHQTQFADTRKFDGLNSGDMALAMQLISSAKKRNPNEVGEHSTSAVKALAIKIAEDKTSNAADEARQHMKAEGINPDDFLTNSTKANELDHNTQAGFGDEWVGIVYSRNLWNVVRAPTNIVGQLPSIEVPQGAESITIPLEAADPTFYKVAATTDTNATTGIPDATVTASKVATNSVSLAVAKGGARTGWNGELDEDSVIPFAAQLRTQLETAAQEQIEHLVIDGDTQTSNANINTAAGSLTTNLFLLFNGFRKSPIVTTTANSRSAGGSLVDTDFLATAQLMGAAGLLGADRQKTAFIVDANVQYKCQQLLAVKTRDVFTQATLEQGMLQQIWGYKVWTSYFMHFASAKRMTLNTGKISATDSGNTLGAILAVRFDQWLLGYKRRITMEVTRYPRSDSSEIVALFRLGMIQRDTEASAITYNVGL